MVTWNLAYSGCKGPFFQNVELLFEKIFYTAPSELVCCADLTGIQSFFLFRIVHGYNFSAGQSLYSLFISHFNSLKPFEAESLMAWLIGFTWERHFLLNALLESGAEHLEIKKKLHLISDTEYCLLIPLRE